MTNLLVKKHFAFLALFLVGSCADADDLDLRSMTHHITVVDENGQPVEGAEISVTFHHSRSQYAETGKRFHVKKASSGKNGYASVSSEGLNFTIVNAEAHSYWKSSKSIDWADVQKGSASLEKKISVVLRKKESPRPLYVYKVDRLEVPGYDQPYGYDLEKADWVAPHGEGLHADFIFTVHGERTNQQEYRMDVEITFSSQDDGLIEVGESELSQSRLLLGRNAPVEGYISEHKDFLGIGSQQGELVFLNPNRERDWEKIEGYWFRVRARPDESSDGGIKARYGKIYGPIKFSGKPEEKPLISFTYFFSPDESRSLEWNGESLIPKANLQGFYRH